MSLELCQPWLLLGNFVLRQRYAVGTSRACTHIVDILQLLLRRDSIQGIGDINEGTKPKIESCDAITAALELGVGLSGCCNFPEVDGTMVLRLQALNAKRRSRRNNMI